MRLGLVLVARDRREGARRARAKGRSGKESEFNFIVFIRTYKVNLSTKGNGQSKETVGSVECPTAESGSSRLFAMPPKKSSARDVSLCVRRLCADSALLTINTRTGDHGPLLIDQARKKLLWMNTEVIGAWDTNV